VIPLLLHILQYEPLSCSFIIRLHNLAGSNLSGDITVSQNMMSTASITNKSTCLASGGSVTSELDEEVCVTRTTEAIPLVSIPLQHTSSPSFPDTSIISSNIANTITGSTHSIYTQVPRQMSRYAAPRRPPPSFAWLYPFNCQILGRDQASYDPSHPCISLQHLGLIPHATLTYCFTSFVGWFRCRRSGMIARSRRKLPTLPHVLTLHTGHSQQEAVQLPNAAIGVQPRGIGLERITNV
jgi:hypothetical protein